MNIKSLGKEAFISSVGATNMIIPMNVTTDCVRQITQHFFINIYNVERKMQYFFSYKLPVRLGVFQKEKYRKQNALEDTLFAKKDDTLNLERLT